MKLKVPKTERKRPQDSRLRRILRRALIIALVVGLMGLAATHLLALITGYDVLAVDVYKRQARIDEAAPLAQGHQLVHVQSRHREYLPS